MALSTSSFDATGTAGLSCSVAGLMPHRVSLVVSSFPSITLEKWVHVSGCFLELELELPFSRPLVPRAACPSDVTAEGLMVTNESLWREYEFFNLWGKAFRRSISRCYISRGTNMKSSAARNVGLSCNRCNSVCLRGTE